VTREVSGPLSVVAGFISTVPNILCENTYGDTP
jgi:hypothetical protein